MKNKKSIYLIIESIIYLLIITIILILISNLWIYPHLIKIYDLTILYMTNKTPIFQRRSINNLSKIYEN